MHRSRQYLFSHLNSVSLPVQYCVPMSCLGSRYGHASVAVGTSVYVIGGSQSKPVTFTQPLDSIECMDTSHGYLAWRLLPNKMSQGRWAPAAAAVGKVIYVTGGWGSSGEPLTSVEMFNTTDLTWTLLTNKVPLRLPRVHMHLEGQP